MNFKLLILTLFLASCGASTPPAPSAQWQAIESRGERFPLYRALVPSHWTRIDAQLGERLEDTTLPLCQFTIDDQVLIAIHNFPTRIPPQMQIERWKKQLQSITYTEFHPQAFGGFSGANFFAESPSQAVLAWAMQLAPEHYSAFGLALPATEEPILTQKRSDYTIKATGTPAAISLYREQIIAFARSFELIDEIPPLP